MCARLPYEYIPCAVVHCINLNYCAHIQNNEFKSSSANIQKKKRVKCIGLWAIVCQAKVVVAATVAVAVTERFRLMKFK